SVVVAARRVLRDELVSELAGIRIGAVREARARAEEREETIGGRVRERRAHDAERLVVERTGEDGLHAGLTEIDAGRAEQEVAVGSAGRRAAVRGRHLGRPRLADRRAELRDVLIDDRL